jgi:hypothetical protein
MVSTNLSYLHDEYKFILRTWWVHAWWVQIYLTYMLNTNLSYVHGEYKFTLRTWWVQIYLTYMLNINLSYVNGEYKFILRTWWVQIYLTYMVSTNVSYIHCEYKSYINRVHRTFFHIIMLNSMFQLWIVISPMQSRFIQWMYVMLSEVLAWNCPRRIKFTGTLSLWIK